MNIADVDIIHGYGEYPNKNKKPVLQNMHGYFIRDKTGLKELGHLFTDGSNYYSIPKSLFIGNWLKDYDATIWIGSMTPWDCGQLVLIKKGFEPIKVPVRCGEWGC